MEEKYIQQFKKGAYEMILLSLIAQKETYGYEILTEIQKQGGEIFAFAKEGTIYPILYRLTKAGLIQYRLVPAKANGGEKKYYSLTGEGKDMLEKMKNFWENYKDCVDGFMKGDAYYEQRNLYTESKKTTGLFRERKRGDRAGSSGDF